MKEYKLIFSIYLSILFVFIVFFLSAVHNSPVNNSMHEWVINYQGGFTRRGFLGELIFEISQQFNFQLKKSFLIFQIIIYLAYFYSLYILFKNIKYNYFFALAIFSPLFFVFSLGELEALGRKDIFMFLVFVNNFLIYSKYKNTNYNYLYFLVSFPVVFLTHEIYIFYIAYFLAFLIIIEKKLNVYFFLKFIFIILFIVFFLELILSNNFTEVNLELLCSNLEKKSQVKCGMAPYFMVSDIDRYLGEVGWKFSHIIRYILIFIFGFIGLLVIMYFSEINYFETNKLISKFNLKFIFIILILPGIIPFLIAVDSGRWMSMTYTFACLFYFGLLSSNLIKLNNNRVFELINNSFLKYKKMRVVLLILLCFSWTPKAVYHEDIGSFPLYRTIIKVPHFIDNFKNFYLNEL